MPTERVENAKGRGPLTALSSTHTLGAIRSKGHLQKGAGGGELEGALDREHGVPEAKGRMFQGMSRSTGSVET